MTVAIVELFVKLSSLNGHATRSDDNRGILYCTFGSTKRSGGGSGVSCSLHGSAAPFSSPHRPRRDATDRRSDNRGRSSSASRLPSASL